MNETQAKTVTNAEQRMRSILAKHIERIGIQPEVPAPKPKPESKPSLQWEKPTRVGQDEIKTVCGRYRCWKVPLEGVMFYDVHRLNKDGTWYYNVSASLRTFEAAKAAAQRDFERD